MCKRKVVMEGKGRRSGRGRGRRRRKKRRGRKKGREKETWRVTERESPRSMVVYVGPLEGRTLLSKKKTPEYGTYTLVYPGRK